MFNAIRYKKVFMCIVYIYTHFCYTTELKLEYETESSGEEYDNLICSQNYEEINLTVRKIDESVIENIPVID